MNNAKENLLHLDPKIIQAGSIIDFFLTRNGRVYFYKKYEIKDHLTSSGHEISIDSPMWRAIEGKKVGDKVSYNIDKLKLIVNIVKIY